MGSKFPSLWLSHDEGKRFILGTEGNSARKTLLSENPLKEKVEMEDYNAPDFHEAPEPLDQDPQFHLVPEPLDDYPDFHEAPEPLEGEYPDFHEAIEPLGDYPDFHEAPEPIYDN